MPTIEWKYYTIPLPYANPTPPSPCAQPVSSYNCFVVKPREVRSVEREDECEVSWTAPLHGAHHSIEGYALVTRRPGVTEWKRRRIPGKDGRN